MARATQRDKAISEAIGGILSASQVNRLTTEGLGPLADVDPTARWLADRQMADRRDGEPGDPCGADPSRDAHRLAHWRQLAPLVGPGRPYDVAALKLAAAGYPCSKLREVLLNLQAPGAKVFSDETVVAVTNRQRNGADYIVKNGPSTSKITEYQVAGLPEADDPREEASIYFNGAREDLRSLLDDPYQEDPCLEDDYEVTRAAAGDLAGHDLPKLGPEDQEQRYRNWQTHTVAMSHEKHNAQTFIQSSNLSVLAMLVKTCANLLDDMHQRLPNHYALGDEEHWRVVGHLVPHFRSVSEVLQQILSGAQVF